MLRNFPARIKWKPYYFSFPTIGRLEFKADVQVILIIHFIELSARPEAALSWEGRLKLS